MLGSGIGARGTEREAEGRDVRVGDIDRAVEGDFG